MKTKVISDHAIVEEGLKVLLEHMPPSKVARLLALWQVGEGDYLSIRDKLFEGETVDSLSAKIVACEDELMGR